MVTKNKKQQKEENPKTERMKQILKLTETDEKIQYAKDIIQIQLNQKEESQKARTKEWIPTENQKWYRKWLGIGKEYNFQENKNIKTPFLLLIMEDRTVEIIEGVKTGMYKWKTVDNDGAEERKGVILTDDKLLKLPYGAKKTDYLEFWIAYENEAVPYPANVKHDSNIIVAYIEKIIANYMVLDQGEKGGIMAWVEKALPWVAGALIVGYLAWYFGFLDGFINTATPVAQNITNLTNQQVNNVIGSGVTVQ